MVAEPESEVASVDALVDEVPVEEALTGAEIEETPEEVEELDPLAELRDQLAGLTSTAATKDELNPLRSDVGRISSIQSRLDELSKRDPLAELDPRIDANEQLTTALAQALIGLDDDIIPGLNKDGLRSATAAVEAARGTRDRDALKRELINEIQGAAPELQAQPTQNVEANNATAQVEGYAAARGVDFSTIPNTAWKLANGETLGAAITRVKAVVDSLATADGAADRVAERVQAAGNGSPARSGNANTIDNLKSKLVDEGPMSLTEAERLILHKDLGL